MSAIPSQSNDVLWRAVSRFVGPPDEPREMFKRRGEPFEVILPVDGVQGIKTRVEASHAGPQPILHP